MREKIGGRRHGRKIKLRETIPDNLQHLFFKKNGQPGLTEFTVSVEADTIRKAWQSPEGQAFEEDCAKKINDARATLGNEQAQAMFKAQHYAETVKRPDATGCTNLDDMAQELATKYGISPEMMLNLRGDLEMAFGTALKPAQAVNGLRRSIGMAPADTFVSDFLSHVKTFNAKLTTEDGQPYNPKLLRNIGWQLGRFNRDIMIPRKLMLADLMGEDGRTHAQNWATMLVTEPGRTGTPLKRGSAEAYVINCGVYINFLCQHVIGFRAPYGNPFIIANRYHPNGIKLSGAESATILPYETEQLVEIIDEALARAFAPIRDNERLGLTHRLRYLELSWAFWVMIFTGMRVESVSEMTTQSIVMREGVRCIHVPRETSKTPAGKRDVPIHSFLAPLIDHLERQADDAGRLFRLAGTDRTGWRDDINAILTHLDIDWSEQEGENGPLKINPFHSTRHNFAVEIKDAPDDVNAALLGHVVPKEREPVRGKLKGPGGYASTRQEPRPPPRKHVPMAERQKWVERIRYPGLSKWAPPRKDRNSFATLSELRARAPVHLMPA